MLFSGLRHSPTLRQDVCQFFFHQIAFTISLYYELGMYALFDAQETLHRYFRVSQVLCTNWRFLLATHDWSRGWNSRQGDGVNTRWPRHLQRSCPLDNHTKIYQLSVLSTWLKLIAWVLLARANPSAVMRNFLSTNNLLFSILEFSAELLIPVFTVHVVKI